MIIDHKDASFDGKKYTYQVNASDSDGDSLTFNLDKAPDGMKIDKQTGLITWLVAPDVTGSFSAQVSVTDGHGGKSLYNFTVNIEIVK